MSTTEHIKETLKKDDYLFIDAISYEDLMTLITRMDEEFFFVMGSVAR
jgi:hypothetical protein